jgi:hypothetical protein
MTAIGIAHPTNLGNHKRAWREYDGHNRRAGAARALREIINRRRRRRTRQFLASVTHFWWP